MLKGSKTIKLIKNAKYACVRIITFLTNFLMHLNLHIRPAVPYMLTMPVTNTYLCSPRVGINHASATRAQRPYTGHF